MRDQPFIVAVISPHRSNQEAIAGALGGHPDVEALLTLLDYPNSAQLSELGKNQRSYIVFLDFTEELRARKVAEEIERCYSSATVVALHEANDPQDVIEMMRIGIKEVVTLPVAKEDVMRVFTRLARKLKAPTDPEGGNLYAFMPAKPGSGATTLASHCASAAARLSNERFLLMDLDFRVGMTSFLFQLHENNSVLKALAALASANHSENDFWDTTVSRRGMLDILGSASVTYSGFDPEIDVVALVDLARQRYRAVFVDLPGEMRDYETEILTRAKECFMVCAPDLGTLHAARRKATTLASLGLQSNISLIMNRVEGRSALPVKDIELLLRLPVRFTVPSAPKEISEATRAGKALEGKSNLVMQIESIAKYMVGTTSGKAPPPAPKKRFLDYFSISDVRDKGSWAD